jgi:hypothetical protein
VGLAAPSGDSCHLRNRPQKKSCLSTSRRWVAKRSASWVGAQDTRFSIVISNESGEGGAAISRRLFGEQTRNLNTIGGATRRANFWAQPKPPKCGSCSARKASAPWKCRPSISRSARTCDITSAPASTTSPRTTGSNTSSSRTNSGNVARLSRAARLARPGGQRYSFFKYSMLGGMNSMFISTK